MKTNDKAKAAEVLVMICPMWGTCLPPLGPAYIASYLESKGVHCDLLDLNITLYDAADLEQKKLWEMENLHSWSREDLFENIRTVLSQDIARWARHIVDSGVGIVGFSISGANIIFSIEMARSLKELKPDMCIVFGGPSCNFLHDDSRMPFRFLVSSVNGDVLVKDGLVDFYVIGEGEEAFFEIVSARRAGRPVNKAGVIPTPLGKRDSIKRAAYIEDLDALPPPAWEKLPLEKYGVQAELPIIFSRGCVNRCAFCNDWRMWQSSYRSRSAENIFAEIKLIHDKYGKKAFRSNDLLFNGNLTVLDKLADLIVASGITVNWTAQGVVRTDMKPELFVKLKNAGMTTIVYGVESLSDNVLKKMRKPFVFDEIRLILKRTKSAGINTWINLIMGFPGETEEDFLETKKRLEDIRDCLDTVSSLNPCNITASTDLEMYPERFGIVFPEGQDGCEFWQTADGLNTFEVRKRRARETYKFLKELRINTHFVGIYDGDSPSQDKNKERRLCTPNKRIRLFMIWKRLLVLPVFIVVVFYHLVLAMYSQIIKAFRNSVIFPGA